MVVERASVMTPLQQNGAMLDVFESESEAKLTLVRQKLDLSVACVNAPTVRVLCGLTFEVAKAKSVYIGLGIQTRRFKSSLAFHSKHMQPIL